MEFKEEVIQLLSFINLEEKQIIELLEVPQDKKYGDLAFPCFTLAKEFKKNPAVIATELLEKIKIPEGSLVKSANAVGPYLNFSINEVKLTEITLNKIWDQKEKYGHKKLKNQTVVEHSFPYPTRLSFFIIGISRV